MRRLDDFTRTDRRYLHSFSSRISHLTGVNEEQFEADLFSNNPSRFVVALRVIDSANAAELYDTRNRLGELLEKEARFNWFERISRQIIKSIAFFAGSAASFFPYMMAIAKRRSKRWTM